MQTTQQVQWQERLYAALYFLSLGMLVAANFALLLQLRRQYNLGAEFPVLHLVLAGVIAGGWFWLAHHKRLLMLRSDPIGYSVYHLLLWIALAQVAAGILADPWHFAGVAQSWQDALTRIEAGPAASQLREVSVLEILRGGVWFIFDIYKSIFFAVFGVLLRIMLTLLCAAALLSGLFMLIVMYFTDIKSGVLMVLLGTLFGGCGWFLQVTDPQVNYGPVAVIALIISVLCAVNWGSLHINVNIEAYHPRFYHLITEFNHQKGALLTRSTVREQIAAMVGSEAGETSTQVVDAIEARLVQERLLVPQEGQMYRPGFQKRLRTWHVLIGGLTLLYVFNPGFGMIELIPDNLPIIGNLDEVILGVGVFAWLYRLYLEDRKEMLGQGAYAEPFPPLASGAPSLPGGVQAALPGAPPTPLLSKDTEV